MNRYVLVVVCVLYMLPSCVSVQERVYFPQVEEDPHFGNALFICYGKYLYSQREVGGGEKEIDHYRIYYIYSSGRVDSADIEFDEGELKVRPRL